ncbi:39s ribosomal protein mitochondrial [Limosa lapponica baueri]|uniref:Large ribosomal subunit protein uL15m n=1 Tax=Limosa lapponica baueri TaxID=1758121 RepID=A0A2I0TGH9_LIMLA|nr:39s ribosomal protein mitochondrial [Limosa lapponica baueri]
MSGNGGTKALELLRSLPRVSLANLRPSPGSKKRVSACSLLVILEEIELSNSKIIIKSYWSLRRQYQPLSLQRLQYLIDLGRVDPTQPIDLTQLTNARGVTVQPLKRDYGVQLVEEGADIFSAKVNIEVQRASELAIATIEKNGGVVTTSFYDPRSLGHKCGIPAFVQSGVMEKNKALQYQSNFLCLQGIKQGICYGSVSMDR